MWGHQKKPELKINRKPNECQFHIKIFRFRLGITIPPEMGIERVRQNTIIDIIEIVFCLLKSRRRQVQ